MRTHVLLHLLLPAPHPTHLRSRKSVVSNSVPGPHVVMEAAVASLGMVSAKYASGLGSPNALVAVVVSPLTAPRRPLSSRTVSWTLQSTPTALQVHAHLPCALHAPLPLHPRGQVGGGVASAALEGATLGLQAVPGAGKVPS